MDPGINKSRCCAVPWCLVMQHWFMLSYKLLQSWNNENNCSTCQEQINRLYYIINKLFSSFIKQKVAQFVLPVVFIGLVHANILSTAVAKLTVCKFLHSGQTVTWQVSITDASSRLTVTWVKPVMDVNLNRPSFVATVFAVSQKVLQG